MKLLTLGSELLPRLLFAADGIAAGTVAAEGSELPANQDGAQATSTTKVTGETTTDGKVKNREQILMELEAKRKAGLQAAEEATAALQHASVAVVTEQYLSFLDAQKLAGMKAGTAVLVSAEGKPGVAIPAELAMSGPGFMFLSVRGMVAVADGTIKYSEDNILPGMYVRMKVKKDENALLLVGFTDKNEVRCSPNPKTSTANGIDVNYDKILAVYPTLSDAKSDPENRGVRLFEEAQDGLRSYTKNTPPLTNRQILESELWSRLPADRLQDGKPVEADGSASQGLENLLSA